MRVAVNLSVRQILNPDIITTVRDAMAKFEVTPADLSLELTESIWMEDIEYCAKILTSFKDLGVGLVIDDFGTGYSSLSYLKLFPFDAVKIDRSFVDGLGKDPNDSALVAAIIAMSDALKLDVTAEGVETRETVDPPQRALLSASARFPSLPAHSGRRTHAFDQRRLPLARRSRCAVIDRPTLKLL